MDVTGINQIAQAALNPPRLGTPGGFDDFPLPTPIGRDGTPPLPPTTTYPIIRPLPIEGDGDLVEMPRVIGIYSR